MLTHRLSRGGNVPTGSNFLRRTIRVVARAWNYGQNDLQQMIGSQRNLPVFAPSKPGPGSRRPSEEGQTAPCPWRGHSGWREKAVIQTREADSALRVRRAPRAPAGACREGSLGPEPGRDSTSVTSRHALWSRRLAVALERGLCGLWDAGVYLDRQTWVSPGCRTPCFRGVSFHSVVWTLGSEDIEKSELKYKKVDLLLFLLDPSILTANLYDIFYL